MKIDSRVKFEEKFVNDIYETTILYFVADTSLLKELVGNKYPEADGMTISIEFPASTIEARYGNVSISPHKEDKEACLVEDYDWTDIDLPYEEIDELIKLAHKLVKLT